MAILSKIQFKYSIMLDMAVLVILIVMQSLLHEASHALAVITLGGEVDAIVIKAFDPEQSYVAYKIVYSDYSELYQAIIKLLPHVLLGIIGFYLIHKGISRIKLAGKNAVDKYPYLLIGLLYVGSGIGWFLPLRYLNLRSYHQFDIPQATLHLSNFAHLRLPEPALFLSNLPAEFQVRLLIFGLIGLSGMIYVGLWRSLGQGDPNPSELQSQRARDQSARSYKKVKTDCLKPSRGGSGSVLQGKMLAPVTDVRSLVVGWVERSETQHSPRLVGSRASTQPTTENYQDYA